MNVEFGLFIQQDSPVAERINTQQGPSFYLKAAKQAEKLGYDSFWQPDHWMLPNNKATFDCWSILAAVAAVSRTIKLGSLVTPIVGYPPLVLSKRLLTVQLISNERTILGAGAGWFREEFDAFGVEFAHHRVRVEMLGEALKLLRLVWGSEGARSYEGRYYSVHGAVLNPKADPPPIWIGGASDKILELVCRYGDGWIPYEISDGEYSTKLVKIDETLDKLANRRSDIKMAVSTRVVAARREEEVELALRRIGMTRDYRTATGQRGHLIAGTFDQCAEELGRYVDAGATYLVVSPQPSDMVGELAPLVRDEVLSKI